MTTKQEKPNREERKVSVLDEIGYKYEEKFGNWNHLVSSILTNTMELSSKEKKVISMRMEGKTLEEVGKEFSVTRERVRQIEAKAQERISSKEIFLDWVREVIAQALAEQREHLFKSIEKMISHNFTEDELNEKGLYYNQDSELERLNALKTIVLADVGVLIASITKETL